MNRSPFQKAVSLAAQFREIRAKREPGSIRSGVALAAMNPEATRCPIFLKKADAGELYVYESIGADWYGGGLTAKRVNEALAEMKGVKILNVFINSEGGDVFEAKAIFTNLKRFDAEKVVHVDGIAASAATLIAMAGDKIITAPVATWMVHEAWSVAMGRAEDMRKMANLLELENGTIAETYAAQTGGTVEAMLELMATETWMNAQTALDKGFTDEISSDDTGDEGSADGANASAGASSALVAASAETARVLSGVTQAQLMRARADMHRRRTPAAS